MKKLLTTLLTIAIILAMCIPVMADSTTGSNTGSILIENANNNRTYMAYKIFDASGSEKTVAYTTDAEGKTIIEDSTTSTESPFSVDDQYNVTLKDGKSIQDITNWLAETYQKFDAEGKKGAFDQTSATVTIDKLSYGYYYVTTGDGSVVSIDTVTGEDKTINDKNPQGPNNPDKKITAEDGINLGNPVTENAAKVGSKESFEITYNATNWVTVTDDTTSDKTSTTKIENFYIKDTPTNLDIDVNSVRVYVNGSDNALTSDDCTISYEDNALKITIPWVNESGNHKYSPNDVTGNIPVKVTYNATITTDAATQVAENKVHIYYNHDSSSGTDGVEVTTPDNPPKTTTYTYKFQLNKVDGSENSLSGAQFELYDGTEKVSLVLSSGIYRAATSDDDTANTTTTIDMTSTGTVEIKGLDNKEYTLKEIKAPEGYNTAANTTIYPSDSEKNGNKLVKADGTYGANAGDAGNVTVVNRAGTTLPTTGGIGTTIFYALGAILVIGAGVALIVRRRMNSER